MQSKTMISIAGFVTMLGLSGPAYAYIDPATGSIILQAAIGAVASATLFFRTSLFRVKSLFVRHKESEEK
jgi:hypothetical protein